MNQPISYGISRNMPATDSSGRACKVALCLVQLPNGHVERLVIPEGLLETVPPDALDDFIRSEVEAAIGYQVTRQ